MHTESDIRRLMGEETAQKGADYLRKGKVLSVLPRKDGRVFSQVEGSKGRIYHQIIEVEQKAGRPSGVEGECSCPVGYNCKHVAAALLKLARPEKEASSASQEQRALPAEIRDWLDEAARAMAPPPPAPAPSPEALYYVFRNDPIHRPLLTPIRARPLRMGGFGKSEEEYWGQDLSAPPRFLTLADAGILQKLRTLSNGVWPRRVSWPEGDDMIGLLREILATGRARLFELNGPPLRWEGPRKAQIAWRLEPSGGQRLRLVDDAGAPLETLAFAPPLWIDRATGACGPVETEAPARLAALAARAPETPPAALAEVARRLAPLEGGALPMPPQAKIERRKVAPVAKIRFMAVSVPSSKGARRKEGEDGLIIPVWRPIFEYEGARLSPDQKGDPTLIEQDRMIILRRDSAMEDRLLAKLEEIALAQGAAPADLDGELDERPPGVDVDDWMFFPVVWSDAVLDPTLPDVLREAPPLLEAAGWTVEIDESWPVRLYDGAFSFEAGAEPSGEDWFSFALKLKAENGEEIDVLPFILALVKELPVDATGALQEGPRLKALMNRVNLYPALSDGRRVPLDGATLVRLARAFLETQGLIGFHAGEAGRAAALGEALEGCGARWRLSPELAELGRKLRALADAPELPEPEGLKARLRPYQKRGYGWLKALGETGFGGALADDMGLGKTVQALALLADRHLAQGSDRPSLLMAPTSLVPNWRREAERFAPDLKILVLHGPERKALFDQIPEHHLIVTTYPLAHRDHERLFAQEYDLAILDEAQATKNPASAIAKLIRDIKARQKIALTGTPIENNLIELWSLFDWLTPGLLGNRADFTKNFRTPIEKQGDAAARRMLAARVRPFLLRRTKAEVAGELPPKTEIDELVVLEAPQRALYESIRLAMDARVRDAIAQKGLNASRITILDALLKLRQACCDPALVKLEAARSTPGSAKRERLMEILEELAAEGRKVLVFSQFVEMLRLIEEDIKAKGWTYAMLTGQTKDRAAAVESFQNGPAQIFLISLKAGGVGLNLTAADTVILYDPWWNPAVERQAMDRAHRIGQDKPVFVHRLIAEGSVEAAIQQMQARKQALADALFEGPEGGPLALDEEDLRALFAPMPS